MIIYEGPSLLNGDPIVAIATGMVTPSTNRKTGPMIQTWILAQNEAPHTAVKSGNDAAVCGDCPARGKWCYVTTFQGPRSIWESWKRGGYPLFSSDSFAGKPVRFGAYGDPAAVPFEVWDAIGFQASMVTGYTHQWKTCDPLHKHYCMASVDTEAEALEARDRGWRTFRLGTKSRRDEVICPASEEGGKKLTCMECGACNGTSQGRKSHIVIEAHGAKTKRFEEWISSQPESIT
jgi:hypothetical protein